MCIYVCSFIVGVAGEQQPGWLGYSLETWRKIPLCFSSLRPVLQWEDQPVPWQLTDYLKEFISWKKKKKNLYHGTREMHQ